MNDQAQTTVDQEPRVPEADASSGSPPEAAPDANDEFRLTIRKLEMPVRPRGVLAE